MVHIYSEKKEATKFKIQKYNAFFFFCLLNVVNCKEFSIFILGQDTYFIRVQLRDILFRRNWDFNSLKIKKYIWSDTGNVNDRKYTDFSALILISDSPLVT